MGQFSWFTQDTHHRIVVDEKHEVIMTDNKGNQYVEHCYEGYGEFGGKDYYELLAEMNGLGSDRNAGIALAFEGSRIGANPNCLHPSISESGEYFDGCPPMYDPDQGFDLHECDDEEYCDEYYGNDYCDNDCDDGEWE